MKRVWILWGVFCVVRAHPLVVGEGHKAPSLVGVLSHYRFHTRTVELRRPTLWGLSLDPVRNKSGRANHPEVFSRALEYRLSRLVVPLGARFL